VVHFIARVGNDSFGDEALRGFQKDGIQVDHVVRDLRAPSGVAMIFVGGNGENAIAVAPGANSRLSENDVRKASQTISTAKVLLMQLETPVRTVEAAAKLVRKDGDAKIVILNPAPACELPEQLLRCITVLTPNETEASLLTGVGVRDEPSAARAAERLLKKGVGAVVITLGATGAFVADRESRGIVASFQVKAVDTTAAGDVFNGALAVALAEGRNLREAAQFANAAAALSVTRMGAQPSAPRRREILRLLKS
jgi:ribokinase